jgi:SAM-dependent methyltransferase
MPEIRAGVPLDWRAYYEREVDLRRFVPEQEPYEEDRVRLVFRLIGNLRPTRILDVGCGDGYLCKRLLEAQIAPRVDGVDIAHPRLRFAATIAHQGRFVAGRIDRLPFRDDAFPLVTAVEVIEHIEDPLATLRELARVSSRYVLITVPNEQVPDQALCPHCLRRFPVDGHLHMFTAGGLAELCTKAELRVLQIERYHVAAAWEQRAAFRWMGDRGRDLFRRALEAAGLLGERRAKYVGVLCTKSFDQEEAR